MLDQIINDSATVERLRSGPLGPYLQSFAESLANLGYATSTARAQIGFVDKLCQWLATNQVRVTSIDERVVGAFLGERRSARLLRRGEPSTVQSFVDHLRSLAVISPRKPAIPDTPLARLEGRYERYLRVERGLTTATVINYLPFVRRLLVERFGDAELKLRKLRSKDISSFVLGHAHSMSPGRAKLMVTAFRSFFQYLLYCGDIEVDLAASVPTVANWRLSSVPKYLTPAELQRVLGACSQSTPTGRRDYAILSSACPAWPARQ
jgi:site-specific recombinase XerD